MLTQHDSDIDLLTLPSRKVIQLLVLTKNNGSDSTWAGFMSQINSDTMAYSVPAKA